MLTSAPAGLQRLLGRVAPAVKVGASLYLALVVIQFVAGFVVGASLMLFDYDLDAVLAVLPPDE